MEERARSHESDFVTLKKRFDEVLTSGQRAEIRRTRSPDELDMVPAYYRLLLPVAQPDRRWQRVAWMLPHAAHGEGALGIGAQLNRGKVNEMPLFQFARSNEPQDLIHLRRLCQQVKPTVHWQDFGGLLFYWGRKSKQSILQDYYLSESTGQTTSIASEGDE